MAYTFYHDFTLDSSCPSTLSPHLQHHYSQFHHQHPPQYQHFYQFCQHPNELQASQQDQLPCSGLVNCPQEDSIATPSFCKALNRVVADAKGEEQEVNKNYGELEAVYNNRKGGNEEKTCVEKSRDGGVMKKGRKRRKVEKEMDLMGAFFEESVQRVIKHQEGLRKRLLEEMERMEKEREEWEARWRVREAEIHERKAAVEARERELASSIVSTIQKISAQSFLLFSRNT
ncbi:hypothetical protein Fmac_000593 [Flemingia macrophylla]|uniref:Uncharacterized protein n=1 Tax=Flemingia macrophylla TaxID=520843 RepID=A0ABD1NGA7_9FABA